MSLWISFKTHSTLTSFWEVPFVLFPSWLVHFLFDRRFALHIPEILLYGGGHLWRGGVKSDCWSFFLFFCYIRVCVCVCMCACERALACACGHVCHTYYKHHNTKAPQVGSALSVWLEHGHEHHYVYHHQRNPNAANWTACSTRCLHRSYSTCLTTLIHSFSSTKCLHLSDLPQRVSTKVIHQCSKKQP